MTSNYWSHDKVYSIIQLNNTSLAIREDFGDEGYELLTFKRMNDDDEQTYLSCPDNNHPHMIDLGLPSGTIWACCNVGASAPEEYGNYYSWGETETKSTYYWSNYIYSDGSGLAESYCQNIGNDIAGTQYDVAHVKWGGSWVMPSLSQIRELTDYCSPTRTTMNGVIGGLFTGPSGGTIFLPAAGFYCEDGLSSAGMECRYWSSTHHNLHSYFAYIMAFYLSCTRYGCYRYYGMSVRPVSR